MRPAVSVSVFSLPEFRFRIESTISTALIWALRQGRGGSHPRELPPFAPASDDRDNALERVVEYHGEQRIQVAKLNLPVPAPRDLDAEVEIEVTEDKAEVVEADGEDGLLGEDHGLDDDLRQHVVDGLITR